MANTCSIASLALASMSLNPSSFAGEIRTPILAAVCCSTSFVIGDCFEAGGSATGELDIEVR